MMTTTNKAEASAINVPRGSFHVCRSIDGAVESLVYECVEIPSKEDISRIEDNGWIWDRLLAGGPVDAIDAWTRRGTLPRYSRGEFVLVYAD